MIGTLALSLVAITAIRFHILPAVRAGRIKETAVYILLLLVGGLFSYFAISTATMPSPMLLLHVIYDPILKALGYEMN